MAKVVDELTSQVYQSCINNFCNSKQWICRWPYFIYDNQPAVSRKWSVVITVYFWGC